MKSVGSMKADIEAGETTSVTRRIIDEITMIKKKGSGRAMMAVKTLTLLQGTTNSNQSTTQMNRLLSHASTQRRVDTNLYLNKYPVHVRTLIVSSILVMGSTTRRIDRIVGKTIKAQCYVGDTHR